jgi:hypothetical protein
MFHFPKLNIIRIPIGLSMVFIGSTISYIQNYFAYFIAFIICSIGGWVFSKNVNEYFRGGIGWLFLGLPLYLYSLTPDAYKWLTYFDIDNMGIFITRLTFVYIGVILFLMVFESE